MIEKEFGKMDSMNKLFYKNTKKDTEKRIITVVIVTCIVALVVLILGYNTIAVIDTGNKGILLTFGEAQPVPLNEGLHVKVPFAQTIVTMSTRTNKYEADASAASKDLQIVKTKVALNYHPVDSSVVKIYSTVGLTYESKIIQPAVQEAVKATTAQFSAEELITKRAQVRNLIEEYLKSTLLQKDIIVDGMAITDFDFSSEFNSAIESKVTAEQQAFKAQNDLQRIKIEQEQKVTIAKADADAKRLNADANAYQMKVLADAEAYSLMVVNEQLQQSKDLLAYKAIETWDGSVPTYSGSGVIPFVNIGTQ